MLQPLDGPSEQGIISVDTLTVQEVKVQASPLEERKVVTLQPTNGRIKVYFGNGTIPNATTVSNNGFTVFKNQKVTYEAADSQSLFIIAISGTVNVIVAERA